MTWAGGEIVGVLAFLLPGFVAALIFYSLTSHPRPGAFDRVVVALVFTLIGQTITNYALSAFVGAEGSAGAIEGWEPGLSVLVAIVLGSCASGVSNYDLLHGLLRWLRLTRETSYPSEFYSTFAQYGRHHCVVLHLRGDRRLYGHAKEWPSDPQDGHFCVTDAEWLDDDNKGTPLKGVAAVLIPATEVVMVEFLPYVRGPE